MCRYGDDFDWYVEHESVTTLERDEHCEDCGRLVPSGEPIVEFLKGDDEYAREDAGLALVAQWPLSAAQRCVDTDRPVIRATDEQYANQGDEWIDTFEALGFIVEEVSTYDLEPHPPEYAYSCRHCRAANGWLEDVCNQTHVLVTVSDLQEHRYEYTDADLGPDFCTLETLATQRWRSKLTGELIPVPVIERLTRDATRHAKTVGLVHA